MRVYELAREAGVTSSAVLKAAEGCGAQVSSAISTIDNCDLAPLRNAVARLEKGDLESVRAAKRAKSAGRMRE